MVRNLLTQNLRFVQRIGDFVYGGSALTSFLFFMTFLNIHHILNKCVYSPHSSEDFFIVGPLGLTTNARFALPLIEYTLCFLRAK